jgi:hypothetical protein
MEERRFVAYFNFVSWYDISLGVSVDLLSPHIDLHLPFGFLRIGWSGIWTTRMVNGCKAYGWDR